MNFVINTSQGPNMVSTPFHKNPSKLPQIAAVPYLLHEITMMVRLNIDGLCGHHIGQNQVMRNSFEAYGPHSALVWLSCIVTVVFTSLDQQLPKFYRSYQTKLSKQFFQPPFLSVTPSNRVTIKNHLMYNVVPP